MNNFMYIIIILLLLTFIGLVLYPIGIFFVSGYRRHTD